MEEADTLADRIAIMKSGQVCVEYVTVEIAHKSTDCDVWHVVGAEEKVWRRLFGDSVVG